MFATENSKKRSPNETYESKKAKVKKLEEDQKEFLCAVLHGELDEVKKFLKSGTVDVEDKNNFEMCTVLHFASRAGNIPIIEELLKNGANIDAKEGCIGKTPIFYAVEKGQGFLPHFEDPKRSSHLEVVKFLLQNGANLHSLIEEDRDTILHLCEVPEVIEFLIKSGVSIEARNKFEETPIYDAVSEYRGNIDILRILLKNGARVNVENDEKMSPLFYAIDQDSPDDQKTEFVLELLKHGANPNAANIAKCTPFQLAMENGNFKIAKELINYGAKSNVICKRNETPLHIAAKNGQVDLVKDLLKNGAKVQARNDQKETPLHLAVKTANSSTRKLVGSVEDHIKIVKELIKHGANVNAIDHTGKPPIFEAIEVETPELAMLLLDHGADPNVIDHVKRSLLHYAAEYKFAKLVERLLKLGVSVNAQDNNKETPLNLAIAWEFFDETHSEHDMIDTALILLKHGANPNSVCSLGNSTLLRMISSPKLASILLDYGGDVNLNYNNSGLTPLHGWLTIHPTVFTPKDEEVVTIMLKKSNHINFTIQFKGKTVLETALEKGYHNIVKMMILKKNLL